MTRTTSPGRTCAQPAGFGMPPTTASPRAGSPSGRADARSPRPCSTASIAVRRFGSIGNARRCATDGATSSQSTSTTRDVARSRPGELDRDLGPADARRTADGHEPAGREPRRPERTRPRSRPALRSERHQRADERVGPGVGLDRPRRRRPRRDARGSPARRGRARRARVDRARARRRRTRCVSAGQR